MARAALDALLTAGAAGTAVVAPEAIASLLPEAAPSVVASILGNAAAGAAGNVGLNYIMGSPEPALTAAGQGALFGGIAGGVGELISPITKSMGLPGARLIGGAATGLGAQNIYSLATTGQLATPQQDVLMAGLGAVAPYAQEAIGSTVGRINPYLQQLLRNNLLIRQLGLDVNPVEYIKGTQAGDIFAEFPSYFAALQGILPTRDIVSMTPQELESIVRSNPGLVSPVNVRLYNTFSEPGLNGGIERPVQEIEREIEKGASAAGGGAGLHITSAADIYKALQGGEASVIQKVGAGAAGFRQGFDQGFYMAPSKVIYDELGNPIRVDRGYNFAGVFGQPPEAATKSVANAGNKFFGVKINYKPSDVLMIDDYAKLTGTQAQLDDIRANPDAAKKSGQAIDYYHQYGQYANQGAKLIESPKSAFRPESETEITVPEGGVIQGTGENINLYLSGANQGAFKNVPVLENIFPTTIAGKIAGASIQPVIATPLEYRGATPRGTMAATTEAPAVVTPQPALTLNPFTNQPIYDVLTPAQQMAIYNQYLQNPGSQQAILQGLMNSQAKQSISNYLNNQYAQNVGGNMFQYPTTPSSVIRGRGRPGFSYPEQAGLTPSEARFLNPSDVYANSLNGGFYNSNANINQNSPLYQILRSFSSGYNFNQPGSIAPYAQLLEQMYQAGAIPYQVYANVMNSQAAEYPTLFTLSTTRPAVQQAAPAATGLQKAYNAVLNNGTPANLAAYLEALAQAESNMTPEQGIQMANAAAQAGQQATHPIWAAQKSLQMQRYRKAGQGGR